LKPVFLQSCLYHEPDVLFNFQRRRRRRGEMSQGRKEGRRLFDQYVSAAFAAAAPCAFRLVWFGLVGCHHFRRRQTKAAKAAASSFCLACLSFFTLLLLFRLLLIYHAMSYDYVGFFKHFKELSSLFHFLEKIKLFFSSGKLNSLI